MPQSLPIFTLFPVLFSISIMWIIAGEPDLLLMLEGANHHVVRFT